MKIWRLSADSILSPRLAGEAFVCFDPVTTRSYRSLSVRVGNYLLCFDFERFQNAAA